MSNGWTEARDLDVCGTLVTVRIERNNGESKAAWRALNSSGTAWSKWNHMTVSEAREALDAGRFDFYIGKDGKAGHLSASRYRKS